MATPSEVIDIIGEEQYVLKFLRGQNEKYSDNETNSSTTWKPTSRPISYLM